MNILSQYNSIKYNSVNHTDSKNSVISNSESSKNEELKKHYNDLFDKKKDLNNKFLIIDLVLMAACLITAPFAGKYKTTGLVAGIASAFTALITYLRRPKKEKYDDAFQKELDKENNNVGK